MSSRISTSLSPPLRLTSSSSKYVKLTVPFSCKAQLTPSPHPSQVEYGGVNFLDIHLRKGSFPLPSLPAVLGVEGAGKIVALPTDEAVLNSDGFKKRGFTVGGKVAFVSRIPSIHPPIPPS